MGQASRIAGMTSFSKGVVAAQNKNDTYLDSMCRYGFSGVHACVTERICYSSYTGCRSCIDACPASTTASAVVKGLGELEYICVESLDGKRLPYVTNHSSGKACTLNPISHIIRPSSPSCSYSLDGDTAIH